MGKIENKKFPTERHTHLIDKIALLNGIISGITLYPQLYKAFALENISGLSKTTHLLILLNSFVWVIYALHRQLISLLIASLLNMIAALLILSLLFL